MRRLMLALATASLIATPVTFAHNHHSGSSHRSHGGSHARSNESSNKSSDNDLSSLNATDRANTVADSGRSHRHGHVPDEEELAQPEQ